MDGGGQEGFYDLFIFLTIMVVAFCLVLSFSTALMTGEEERRSEDATDYARDSLRTLLSSTVDGAFYLNRDGTRVELGKGTTVERLLLEETYLVSKGREVKAFVECNSRVEAMSRALISGAYDVAIIGEELTSGGRRIWVTIGTHHESPGFSSAADYSVHGVSLRIKLVLWWS